MHKYFLVVFFFLCSNIIYSQSEEDLEAKLKAQQEQEQKLESESKKDSLNLNEYQIFYLDQTIKNPDTSLTIYKDYNFNFLREDTFDLISFANTGYTYNKLSYDFLDDYKLPDVGASGKHFNYFEKEDIGYYKVATPFTEIFAKSTFEQGQILDFLVSVNLNPNYNFTIAHKGYKSLGKYVASRVRGNQFRFSSNFNSKNNQTNWRFHLTSQNLFNQENGGLTPDDIYFFEQAPDYFELDENGNQIVLEDGSFKMVYYDGFLDRSRLGTWLFAESSLYSKRFFSDFKRTIIKNSDNREILSLGYRFTHEYKKLKYSDPIKGFMFGEFNEVFQIEDESRYILQENEIIADINLSKLSQLKIGFNLVTWENSFNEYSSEITSDLSDLPLQIDFEQFFYYLKWYKNGTKLNYSFNFSNSVRESLDHNIIQINISGSPIKNINFDLKLLKQEKSPNLNFYLTRSIYDYYNWFNSELEPIETLSSSINLSYKDYIKISADYNQINNYTFFTETANNLNGEIESKRFARVEQRDDINYFRAKLESKIDIGKFSFVNTGMYQKVDQVTELGQLFTLNVPEWITRNTIMYSSKVFNNSLFIQTGITFNYFTKFYADYYNPLISEFVTQNYKQIGDYPRFDFFFNAKIQQTRVFVKVEHLNSSFTGYDFYSDPFNPYRDLSVRLGLVWNFFQ